MHMALDAEAIFLQNADGMIIIDQSGRVQRANPAAERYLGYRSAELEGWAIGVPLVGGESTEIEIVRDGQVHIAEMRLMASSWAGQPAHVISLRDRTEQHLAAQRLREAEAFRQAIFNALVIQICVIDDEGVIIDTNAAWSHGPGGDRAPEQSAIGIGANYFDACRSARNSPEEQDAQAVLAGLSAVIRGDLPFFEYQYPCNSPTEERWFLMRVVPMADVSPRRLIISHLDVTSQHIAARALSEAAQLRAQLQQQQQELRSLGSMGSQVSPGTRTPPLRERMPATFGLWVQQYSELLDHALNQQIFQASEPASVTERELAVQIGQASATPRDVIDIHLAALQARSHNATQQRIQAYLEEGRILVLAVMGHLASYYRSRNRSIRQHSGQRTPAQRPRTSRQERPRE